MSPHYIPVIILTLAIYFLAEKFLFKKENGLIAMLSLLIGGISLFCASLFSTYYLHLFDDAILFYQFRALPLTEYTVIFSGLPLYFLINKWRKLRFIALFLLICFLTIPYLKMLLLRLPSENISNLWRGNVCLQTTSTTCGAASTATILKQFEINKTEKEVAVAAYTTRTSTENWYLARYIRSLDLHAQYLQLNKDQLVKEIPSPAIAGVNFGGGGHFIPIIKKENGIYHVGDPLIGPRTYSHSQLLRRYQFTGFFLKISK